MTQLVVEKLGKQFGRRVLFRGLTFTLAGGHSLAVTGSNGSGKSTLLRILAGVLTPTAGRAVLRVGAEEVPGEERALRTGYVAPYLQVYDDFSPRENLRFLARARRLPTAAARIDEVLALVGLPDRADDPVATFSSGMKQRVKVAAALLAEPPLLLLDEPSSNLDVAGLAMIEEVEAYQREQGRLLIVATNDAGEAARCDEVLCVEDFR